MDKAKQTISSFMSHNNEHKTTVDQDQRAAVTEEHIRPERHEQITTAIDKEIHQDHHQTIIQPIKQTEKLAEKHIHNAVAVQHKTFEHDKADKTKAMLDEDAARYRDSSVTHDTVHTTSKGPVVESEHVHHHLHQHIQPVIQKETIAPEVVHTTVPIHETHHAASVNHGTTTLPAKSIEEFEREHGGLRSGKSTTAVGEFDGCAKTFVEGEKGTVASHGSNRHVEKSTTTANQGGVKSMIDGVAEERTTRPKTAGGSNDYKIASQAANRAYNDSSVPRSNAAGTAAPGVAAPGVVSGKVAGGNLHTSTSNNSGSTGKVSLKDKLNPFKDADGDGKKGIMS